MEIISKSVVLGAEATQEGDLFVEINAANEFEDDDDDGGDDDDDDAIDAMVAEIENDNAMLGNNEIGFLNYVQILQDL